MVRVNGQDFIDLWKNVNLTKEQEQSIIQRIKAAQSQPKESVLSNMKQFDAVQNEIGNQLEKETSTTFTVTLNRRRSRFFGSGAAATAAVLIVAAVSTHCLKMVHRVISENRMWLPYRKFRQCLRVPQ